MKPGRKTLTILLVVACILSGIMLALTPSAPQSNLNNPEQIDSLIVLSLEENGFEKGTYRIRNIDIDTSFSRKIYQIELHPSVSKTSLHLAFHHRMLTHNIATPARIQFPERDMNIYFISNGTIFRTLRLTTMNLSELDSNDRDDS